MEREALAALEKRVVELRVLTAEKAVHARSLSDRQPMRFAREIATAILAAVVLAAFLFAREVGIFAAAGNTCLPMHPNEFAWIHMGAGSYSVTMDTSGNVTRDVALDVHAKRPGAAYMSVPPEAVHEIANRLVKGCFFDRKPPYLVAADATWVVLTLRVGDRTTEFSHMAAGRGIRLCGGTDDLEDIERAIANLARIDEAL
jgi:hypothetical protein